MQAAHEYHEKAHSLSYGDGLVAACAPASRLSPCMRYVVNSDSASRPSPRALTVDPGGGGFARPKFNTPGGLGRGMHAESARSSRRNYERSIIIMIS